MWPTQTPTSPPRAGLRADHLSDGDGRVRGHPARRSDPVPAELQLGAAGLPGLPEIRVMFDNGAGGPRPGMPYRALSARLPASPCPDPRRVLVSGGRRAPVGRAARTRVVQRFTGKPGARPATDFTGDTSGGTNGLWTETPPYRWTQNPAGSALSYVSPPLTHNAVVIGAGAVQAWVRASVPSVDLQVTVTEVRPDGKETFVQGGWLRTSLRKLDPRKSSCSSRCSHSPRRRRAARARALHRGDDPALLRGPRIPPRVTHPHHHQRAQRRSADLGVCPTAPERPGPGMARPVAHDAGTARAPGCLGGVGGQWAATVPGLAG